MRLLAWLLVAAVAASATGPAAAAATSGPIRRATSVLGGKRFTRFVDTGSIGVPSSYDERLHLCRDGRFVFDQVSSLSGVTDPTVTRTTGRWRVISASFSPNGRRGLAHVQGVPERGPSLVIVIATDGRRTTIDGRLVVVGRSDLCR
jgi:hypothetical protein